jgi:hypothetical protein
VTPKAVAGPSRPLEQRSGRSQGASTANDRAPGSGEADELNVLAWLWPELTMHLPIGTGRRKGRVTGPHGMLAESLGIDEVACCARQRGHPRAPQGSPVAIVAGDNPGTGLSRLPLRAGLTARP